MADDGALDKAALLEGTRWATDLDAKAVATLAGYLAVVPAKAGETVCREGERDATLFIVVEGRARVVKQDVAGLQKVLASFGPGQTVGEMALVDGGPRSASVVAETDLVLLSLARKDLDRLAVERPPLAVRVLFKLAAFLSLRLRQTSGALAERVR